MKPGRTRFVVLTFALCACDARELNAQTPATPTGVGRGIIVRKNVMMPMRDGVRLATDLYRPAAGGKFPVVLIRTPYGSETADYSKRGQYYAEHGYVLAVQDLRGKYESEGEWYGPRDEARDTGDAITWLGEQGWS
ncbi:MAG: CocE/NonD family hydrolase, partial [Cytophagaceae bacterium]|nr:CocE/NonD family hydrolase [Gemmatimonadaceae bacterium]